MFEDFPAFLDALVDPAHERYQAAWREFERRYWQLIIGKLHRMTRNEELVNESLSRVLERLVERNYKVLKNFKERSSENAFKVFLLTITRNIVLSELKKRLFDEFNELEISGPGSPSPHVLKDVHGEIVLCFRYILATTKKDAHQRERDIFIFALRKMAKFSAKEVSAVPVVAISSGDVANVIHRLMKRLKEKRIELRDLLH